MQKEGLVLIMLCALFYACNQPANTPASSSSADTTANKPMPVFPVTDYLLGQIKILESAPVTPLETMRKGNQLDSNWIKREEVRGLAAPFLSTPIDSVSLNRYFKGNSFLDQTINAVTFTYSAKPDVPNDMSLREVNVYVQPQTGEVERIYLVKENKDTTFQLTWKSGQWFSIRSIYGDGLSEKKVVWNFDEQK